MEKTIKDYLGKLRGNCDQLRLMYEVALAIDYLHSGKATESGHPLLHGDIRPSKILISRDRHAKLTGFRRSKILEEHILDVQQNHSVKPGNEIWRAPEIYKRTNGQTGMHNITCDVYAWALTAASIFCTDWMDSDNGIVLACPYSEELERGYNDLLEAIKDPEATPYKEDLLETAIPNESLRNLLIRCWSKQKTERPPIGEVITELRKIGGYEIVNKSPPTNAALLTPPETPPRRSMNL